MKVQGSRNWICELAAFNQEPAGGPAPAPGPGGGGLPGGPGGGRSGPAEGGAAEPRAEVRRHAAGARLPPVLRQGAGGGADRPPAEAQDQRQGQEVMRRSHAHSFFFFYESQCSSVNFFSVYILYLH